MAAPDLPNDYFLLLLEKRRKKRAAILSSVLRDREPVFQPEAHLTSTVSSAPDDVKRALQNKCDHTTNLSTYYLFSSSHPQNEIQNPYPNCFEGYPKLQRHEIPSIVQMLITMQTDRIEKGTCLP